ncbi:cell division protein ZipA [Dyella tabacisoli]|uniref:Cell division protein ZipA n=2 Tax=Dyella tabacisoli TaxID=2282381 RepID=A0A369UVV0_9GAMM|nr:cell division protein ZipA [Dyella tabacisoli]RDD83720.1 cell division protein ZipA [Dyella tabacisoli]
MPDPSVFHQSVLALAWNPAVGIPLLIVGAIVLAVIWLLGQPKKEQGKRRVVSGQTGERREPTMGDAGESAAAADEFSFNALSDAHDDPLSRVKPQQGELDVGLREELERLGATLAGDRAAATSLPKPTGHAASIVDALRAPSQPEATAGDRHHAPPAAAAPAPTPAAPALPPRSDLGRRPAQMPVERIITLFVVAREGGSFHGADLIVAAEKAGLEFGDMGIYHRLLDGKRELGPIFSVANMLKPGNFDLGRLDALRTPGLSFFMALPAPIPALDAWDAMLPTAQRLAELLDGQVLDEERNALGRQRIAHIRDELRGWDRDHEGKEITFGR